MLLSLDTQYLLSNLLINLNKNITYIKKKHIIKIKYMFIDEGYIICFQRSVPTNMPSIYVSNTVKVNKLK